MSVDTSVGASYSAGRTAAMVRDLPPAAFAFVMATGIISADCSELGPAWLSQALLGVASAGLVLLSCMLVARFWRYRPRLVADGRTAEKTFGFFTIVAGLAVVAVRLDRAGHPVLTAAMAGLAAAIWLGLTYGIPAGLVLGRATESALEGVNGTWLLWVVGTQSLAIAASVLVPFWPARAGVLAPVAISLWAVGLVLYLVLVALILVRWLAVPVTPAALGPPYWILMGATAITVRAGAQLVGLPAALPVTRATSGFISGFSFALWAFGTWWIPMLIVFGIWRHVMRHWPLAYETALWSAVFPLGMYASATAAFGHVTGIAWMEPIARAMLWVAVAAWTVVAASGVVGLARPPKQVTSRPG